MKKIYSSIAILALATSAIFSSCSKKNDDPAPVTPITPDVAISLNENTNSTNTKGIYVKRERESLYLQVGAVSITSTDMKRIYVYKKASTTTSEGVYESVNSTGFKKDANNNYYYDIPTDQRNNAILNLTVTLNANNTAAVSDEYYFAFTDGTAFAGPADTEGMLVGPAKIYIIYGKLTETTGHKLNNIYGPNSGAFDLQTLKNKAASEDASGKDMNDADLLPTSGALWTNTFDAGESGTLYAKLNSSSFDYDNATDISIKFAYLFADNATKTQTNVAKGDIFVARIRNTETYALIKVTSISAEDGGTGAGKNNEFMEFSVKK